MRASGMWGFWLFGLLWPFGLVLLVVLAVRAFGGGINPRTGDRPQGPSRAREILNERYARGELSTEEYRERLQTLGEYGEWNPSAGAAP